MLSLNEARSKRYYERIEAGARELRRAKKEKAQAAREVVDAGGGRAAEALEAARVVGSDSCAIVSAGGRVCAAGVEVGCVTTATSATRTPIASSSSLSYHHPYSPRSEQGRPMLKQRGVQQDEVTEHLSNEMLIERIKLAQKIALELGQFEKPYSGTILSEVDSRINVDELLKQIDGDF